MRALSERELRAALSDYAHRIHARGWVANHDGNLTCVADGDHKRILATPTAESKAAITPGDILVVNDTGERIAGHKRVFGELGLHLVVYKNRSDVRAVVHAHPPAATAIACSGSDLLRRPFMPEAVVSLGACIPTVPFAAPGDAARQGVGPFTGQFDAVLLENHGVLTWGHNVEQAYLRLELVEHLATIALYAQAVGGVRPLPEAVVTKLLASRRKAGLGLAAERILMPAAPQENNLLTEIRREVVRHLDTR